MNIPPGQYGKLGSLLIKITHNIKLDLWSLFTTVYTGQEKKN